MNDVYKFIEELNIKNKTVIAAISGGPDSMLLLDILLSLKDKLNIKIVVAHVHHNLRKESDEEAKKVQKFSKTHNLIFEFMKIDEYPNHEFSEEVARKIRYEFFDKLIEKYKTDILFTGHHADDLIETILMRISRGSTLKGYAGFEEISTDRGYKIVRPLIYLTKSEIEDILIKKNIWFAKDMSNKNDKYTRNRYRKYILPELKKENSNIHYKFIEYNKKLLLANQYIKTNALKVYKKCVLNNEINIDIFNKQQEIIKIYIIEEYLKNIYNEKITKINSNHVDMIIKNIKKNTNMIFDLPDNKKGIIEYNKFKVTKVDELEYDYTFTSSIKLPNGKTIKIDNSTKLTTNYVTHLNSKDLKFPLHVRSRRPNDR